MKGYDEIINRLNQIAGHWYLSSREGPTGIGKTLEDLLGICENNIPGPNGEMLELKAIRDDAKNMITLFTKSPEPKNAIRTLLNKFGYEDRRRGTNRLTLHETLSGNDYTLVRNKYKLKVNFGTDNFGNVNKIVIVDDNNTVYAYWMRETLRKSFENKMRRVLLVKAKSRRLGNRECLCYHEGLVMKDFSFENFLKLIMKGTIKIDLRIGLYENGRTHDHGTGFRVTLDALPQCFKTIEKVLDVTCNDSGECLKVPPINCEPPDISF